MDYVVFGIGFGAALVLLGWALRRFGPRLRHQAEDGDVVLSGEQLLAQLSWSRFVAALGAVVGTGGAVMVLATMAMIVVGPRDRLGTLMVLSCFLLILIAGCAWAWIYIGRYGTHGILPQRAEPDNPLRSSREAAPPAQPVPEVPLGPATVPAAEQVDEVVPEPAFVDIEPEPVEEIPLVLEPEAEMLAAPPAEQSTAGEAAGVEPKREDVVDDMEVVPEIPVVDAPAEVAPVTDPDSEQPDSRNESSPDDEDGEQFVDIVERTAPSPEESGRAEALRRLRMRRSSRAFSSES